MENPSFLTLDAQRNLLFAVSEIDGGAVVSYHYNAETSMLTEINRQSTFGDFPCHLNIDDTGKWLFAVNYMSGSVCLYPIQFNGVIGAIVDRIQHMGHSIHYDRQKSPHPHSIVNIPHTNYWLVPDLGTDRIYIYQHDPLYGKLHLQDEVQITAGSGPRHVAFHPSKTFVYITGELSSTIAAYRFDQATGSLTFIQSVSTLPTNFTGESTCADIHITHSGNFLYGSNRGHDSIAVFRILDDGQLESLGFVSTMGKTPRNFTLVLDDYLLVANQDSNSIVVYKLSEEGIPVPNGQILKIIKPVCLKVLPRFHHVPVSTIL